MREVFLEDLPRIGKYINWEKSVGRRIRFVYDDIESEFKVVGYNKTKYSLNIKYGDKIFELRTDHFLNCRLGKVIGRITNEFKIDIGNIFKDDRRDMTIIDREYRKDKRGHNWKMYRYTCNKCGWKEGWIVEGSLLKGIGCACCCSSPKTAVKGINDVATTAPWMIDLGVDKEEAKKFTKASHEKIKCVCPFCGEIKYKYCSSIYAHKSIACLCGDGYSYPEKILYSTLRQFNTEIQIQYEPKWSNKKRYDFYIPKFSTIIEVHGKQHYNGGFNTYGGRSLKTEQKNDRLKKELALSNGIKHYIELDCRESSLDWIKNSVLNSELNELFDLSNVNWLKCEEYAIKSNIVKEVCEYWNSKEEWETTRDLGEVFSLSSNTIGKYLKRGLKLGWCNYDAKEEKSKAGYKSGKSKCKKVEVFKDGISVSIFNSCMELEKQSEKLFGTKLDNSKISMVCNGKRNQHKGFTFRYI